MKKSRMWYIVAYALYPLQWLIAHSWILFFKVFRHMSDEQAREHVIKMLEENEYL